MSRGGCARIASDRRPICEGGLVEVKDAGGNLVLAFAYPPTSGAGI